MLLLATLLQMYPFLKKLFADSGDQKPNFQKALAKILPQLETEIVKRSDQMKDTDASTPLARRTHLCLAQPLPKACQILKNLNRNALAFLRLPQSVSCFENFVITPHLFRPLLRPSRFGKLVGRKCCPATGAKVDIDAPEG